MGTRKPSDKEVRTASASMPYLRRHREPQLNPGTSKALEEAER